MLNNTQGSPKYLLIHLLYNYCATRITITVLLCYRDSCMTIGFPKYYSMFLLKWENLEKTLHKKRLNKNPLNFLEMESIKVENAK